MDYIPRLSHAIGTVLLALACMLISSRVDDREQTAWNIGAFAFALLTAVVLWLLIIRQYDSYNMTILAALILGFIYELSKDGRK